MPGINGVLVPVLDRDLQAYDIREEGYTRLNVPLKYITFLDNNNNNTQDSAPNDRSGKNSILENHDVWIYLPCTPLMADKCHPLIQTYIDTCLRGCLEVGGKEFAIFFLRSTFDWSDFFLNDTPISRRPWEHRLMWREIEACLSDASDHIKLTSRKHPEEFSVMPASGSTSNEISTRGKDTSMFKGGTMGGPVRGERCLWNAPPRNYHFIGRECQLTSVHDMLCKQVKGSSNHCMLFNQATIIGLGGVGE
jgi:hypothetical protein